MKLRVLNYHIMLYSSEETYIKIGHSSTTSEYIYERPSERYSKFDHQNGLIRMDIDNCKVKSSMSISKNVSQLS